MSEAKNGDPEEGPPRVPDTGIYVLANGTPVRLKAGDLLPAGAHQRTESAAPPEERAKGPAPENRAKGPAPEKGQAKPS